MEEALAREGATLTVIVTSGATVAEVLDLMHVKAVHRVWWGGAGGSRA